MAVRRKPMPASRRRHGSKAVLARRRPWRRMLMASVVTVVIACSLMFAFFLSTGCWSSDRPFPQALDDFFFTLHTFTLEEFGGEPEPFSDERYDEVVSHLDRHADGTVRGAAYWHLEQWGEVAVPRLLVDLYSGLDRHRRLPAIRILGKHRVREATSQLTTLLNTTTSSFEREKILDSLDLLADPRALPGLIEYAEKLDRQDREYHRVLGTIARTGVAIDYLVGLVQSSKEPRPEVFEALVLTGDDRGVEIVAAHLDHLEHWVRRVAAVALSRSADTAPLLLDSLASERDDFQRELLVGYGLAGPRMAKERAVAGRLGELKNDPIIGPTVVKTLAEHDTPWAMAALWDCQEWPEPAQMVDQLDPAIRYGPSLLEAFLRHDDRGVRTRAAIALADIHEPVCAALLQQAAMRDPDERVRSYARKLLLTQDKFRLHSSMRRYRGLPEKRWSGWSPPLRSAPELWRSLHFVACAFASVLALTLVFGWVKPLEPDRFRFFMAFFLVEGFLGDFMLLDDSETVFLMATGIHTLLLAGLLLQDRAFVRRRFERVAGASLWVFVPCLMYWGAPVIADALRAAAGEFSFFLALWVLLVLNVVSMPAVFVSWLHLPIWMRRGLVSGVLCAFLVVLGLALGFFATVAWHRGDVPDAVISALLLVPLAFKLASLLADPGSSRKGVTPSLPSGSPGRIRLLDLGPTTTLRLPQERLWGTVVLILIGGAILAGTGHTVGQSNLGRWGTGELIFTFGSGGVGALMVGLGLCGILCRHVIQIRDGLMRHGVVVFGAVVSRTAWRRSPPGNLVLSEHERDFVRALVDGSSRRKQDKAPHSRAVHA